ncbi:MAG: response regulator receiver [Frankiales bacterium]|nr:response regulator receiver [Frankiales bacterium]
MTEQGVPAIESKRALVAEDDRDIRELVESKLISAGFDVIAVADGHAAMNELTESRFDIALLDVMMPGLSGLDIMRKLRDETLDIRLPVILLTAKSQEFEVETGFALGADDYVVKPFSPRDLLQRVEAVLARSAP